MFASPAHHPAGDKIPHRLRVRVAEIGHVVEVIILVAVFDPEPLAGQLPGYCRSLFQIDIEMLQNLHEFGITGDFIIVITGQNGYLDLLPCFPECPENIGELLHQGLQFLRALDVGKFPHAEDIAHNNELGFFFLARQLLQKRHQLRLIIADAQSLIASNVQVADQIITFSHVMYLRATGDLADCLHPWG